MESDLHWHDLRLEGALRLLADGVDIRTIQLMLRMRMAERQPLEGFLGRSGPEVGHAKQQVSLSTSIGGGYPSLVTALLRGVDAPDR